MRPWSPVWAPPWWRLPRWLVLAVGLGAWVWAASGSSRAAVSGQEDTVASPDERLRVSLRWPEVGGRERPEWTVTFRGKTIVGGSTLGLDTADGGERLGGVRVLERRTRAVDERVPVLHGKADHAADRFREVRWVCEDAFRRRTEVVFRCYDDAVAFRYEILEGAATNVVTVVNEGTAFGLVGEPRAFVQYLENFRTSHEHEVVSVPWSEIRRGMLVDVPATFAWGDGTYAAITEAALRRYAGMSLMRGEGTGVGEALVAQLTPRADGTKAVRPLPMRTPWRVVLVSDRAGALLESGTLYALNDPPAIGDTGWIQPGKITFHWWNGDVFDGRPGAPILSFEVARRYIDFCASNGIAAHSLTSTENTTTPWYHQTKPGVEPGPDTDVTRPREGFDLEGIREYARSKGVRLWTWVHQAALRGRLEEAFTAFERMGWSGLMVDFFDHDDQETVEFAEAVLESAARHRLLVHLHGVWKPTGWQRTYPNLMNHEGALNLEYLKWSDRCTPRHDVMMAFTRAIAGPMDYHLGGFRSVPRERFGPRNVAPNVLGTRGHMLAMYVCYENPMPMVADYPTAYEGQPGFDFLRRVPTWWDETRVVAEELGKWLVVARRRGVVWYLGGLSAGAAHEQTIPLRFLSAGRYSATVWGDAEGEGAGGDPNRLSIVRSEVSSPGRLTVRFAEDGGFVAELRPGPSR